MLRSVARVLSNSLWGKFGENINRTETVYMNIKESNAVEQNDKIYDRIKSTCLINDNIAVYSVKQEEKEMFEICMTIAAFTSCCSRLQLYSALEKVDKQGGKVLYCDTDSVIFTDATLPTGAYYGQFKNELGNEYITDFVSIGAKSYAFKMNNSDNTLKTKGISKRYIDFRFGEMEKLVTKELTELNIGATAITKNCEGQLITENITTCKRITAKLDKRIFKAD